ncbi:hypothetical protein Aduo_000725 [Ancylostoma duodenale]
MLCMHSGCFMLLVASPQRSFDFLHEVEATETSETVTSVTGTESPPLYQEQARENNKLFSYSMGILCALVLILLLIICFATKAERVKRKEKIRYMKKILEEREMNQKKLRSGSRDTDGRRKSKEESAQKDRSDELALTPNKLRKQGLFSTIKKDASRQNSMEGSPPTVSMHNVPAYVRAHSIAKTRHEDTYSESLRSFFLPFKGRAARSTPRTPQLQLTVPSMERISGEMLERIEGSKKSLKPLQVTQMDSQRLATLKTARQDRK